MFVQILFPLQSVPADGHAVVGGVDDVSVVQLAHRLELGKHAANLLVDVFAAGKLPTNLIAYGAFVTPLSNASHLYRIAKARVAMVKGVFGQPVDGQIRLLRIGRRQGGFVAMVHSTVFFQKLRRAIADIVWMRKSKIDQEGICVLDQFAFV